MKGSRHFAVLLILVILMGAPTLAVAGLCSAIFSQPSGINENLTGTGNVLNPDALQFQGGAWPASGVPVDSEQPVTVSDPLPDDYRLNISPGEEVVIYVSGNLTIPRGTRLNEDGSPGQLLIIVEGNLTIEGGGNNQADQILINGFLYAGGDTSGNIDVGNNVFIDGALASGGNTEEGNRSVQFSPADLNPDLFDGLCDVGVSISVNGDSFGPVDVDVDQPSTLSASSASCMDAGFLQTRFWREVWTIDGQVIVASDFQTTSSCDRSPVDLPWTFDTAGLFEVGVDVQYVDCNLFLGQPFNCSELQSFGSDVIEVNVESALTCFSDDYAEGTLNPDDWVASVARGSFTPSVVQGRLRMTEASSNQSTALTLQREIPGADNLVILQFDYYAYGGSGADGVSVVLSDALITPQPGSFGGSLGYAQRNNGDPGFAGGWLGIGLDEYGNFSNPSEGRQGGPGRIQQSVSIRGSGSGASGYKYLEGTTGLTPGVDSTGASNPHRYRITVDSRSAGQAMVSVERDTGSGSGFEMLIDPFNVLADADQAAVPENFLLSLTGSTGGSNNIHELDDLELCALQLNPIGEQVDHFEIVHDGVALTCQPETVTIRACANADCSDLFTDPVEATLSPTDGWVGGNVVSISGGTGQASLQNTTAGDVELDVIGSQPSARPQSVTLCEEAGSNPSAANCVLSFLDAGLAFDIPDMISHREEQSIQVRAVERDAETDQCVPAFENVDRTVGFWSTYIDPDSSGRPASRPVSVDGTEVSGSASSPTLLTLNFGAGGVAEIDVRYPDAGHIQLGALYQGSVTNEDEGLMMPGADIFTSRPAGLCVATAGACAAADASCPTFVKAGESFDLSVTAVGWQSDSDTDFCAGNPTTPNFAMPDIALASQLVAPSAGVSGTLDPLDYDHLPSADATTVVPSTMSEVGVFRFNATPVAGGYFGQTVPPGTSLPAGRFYPDRFIVSVDPGEFESECVGPPSFTYTGQDFGWLMAPSLLIEPVSVSGNRTRNYANPAFTDPADRAFQKLSLADISSTVPAADRAAVNANGDPLAVTISSGTGTLSAVGPGLLEFVYSAGVTASYDKVVEAKVAPVANPTLDFVIDSIEDSDNVAGVGAPYTVSPVMDFELRYGRLEMDNVYGPENLTSNGVNNSLFMPFRVEYWNGSRFILNQADNNCTTWDTATITDTENFHALQAANGSFSAGEGGPLALDPNGTPGEDTLTWALPLWLWDDQDGDGTLEQPSALATFGVYRGNDRVIYWQER